MEYIVRYGYKMEHSDGYSYGGGECITAKNIGEILEDAAENSPRNCLGQKPVKIRIYENHKCVCCIKL